jgi:hypothetical protein
MPDKITTRIVQDGMEISWERQRDTPLSPEDAAKLSVEGVEALQKFKDKDPRTQPELRQKKKDREEGEKATRYRAQGIVFAILFGILFSAFYGGDCRGGGRFESRSSAASGVNYGSSRGGCN